MKRCFVIKQRFISMKLKRTFAHISLMCFLFSPAGWSITMLAFITSWRSVIGTQTHGNESGAAVIRLQLTAKCKCCEHKGRVSTEHTSFIIHLPLSIHLRRLLWQNNGPPPDLISTWHNLSAGRSFHHCPHTGTSFVDARWKISRAVWRNNDSHSCEGKLGSRGHEISPSLHITLYNPWEIASVYRDIL